MADLKNNVTKTRVECFKEETRLDKENKFKLFIKLDDAYGFTCNDEVIVLKYSDFPDLMHITSLPELKKKMDELRDNAKRVRVLKNKLESAQESYKEGINELKAKQNLEMDELKNENSVLENDNKKLKEDLKKVNIRINEINNILKDSK